MREKERERNIDVWMCERHTDQSPHAHPQWGTQPTTQAYALTGNWTGDLSFHRPALNPLSHPSQGIKMNIVLVLFLSGWVILSLPI